MAEDPFSAMGDKITSKHRTATIGRYQADKRRARGNLPTWSEVSAMYADEPLVEEELSPKSETNKRWTVSLASSSLLDFSDHSSSSIPTEEEPTTTNGEKHDSTKIPTEIALLPSELLLAKPLHAKLPQFPTSSAPAPPISEATASSSTVAKEVAKTTSSASVKPLSAYEEYLEAAKKMDFTSIRESQFAYQSGVDFAGRPVVVVCGAMPACATADDLFLYIIDLLDPISEGDYSVIYVVMSEGKKPGFGWLRKVYGNITRKYKKNLKQLFIVNPSFWVKAGFQFFRPFISGKFWKKVVYVTEVRQLYQYMSPTQIRFPGYVTHQVGFIKNTNAMFGQSLELAMAHPMNRGLVIPCLVQSAIEAITANGVELEGIFRISGNAATIKHLQESFDKGQPVDLIEEQDVHAVAGLLKRYLRELPEPLVPFHIFPLLIQAITEPTEQDIKFAFIQAQLCELSQTAFTILDRIIRLCVKIASKEETNRMGPSNLAIVMGPNLMYGQDAPGNPAAAMAATQHVIAIMTLLISHSDTLLSAGRIKYEC